MRNVPSTTPELVTAFLVSGESRGLSTETIRWYKELLDKLTRQYPELPTVPEFIESYISSFQSSSLRRHSAYRAVRAFYNWLETRYSLPNPVKLIKPPLRNFKEKHALSEVELKKLLEYPGHTPDIKAILYFLADTGARIGEVYNLETECIFEDSVKLTGKTGERLVPISPIVRKMLLNLSPGKIWTYSLYNLRRKISKAFKEAGVTGTAHTLRHTLASNWNGSDLALKTIGGWRSWAMVEHYSHRKVAKAIKEHQIHSPITLLYGANGGKQAISGNGRTINLIVNNPVIYNPEPREWAEVEIDGEVKTLMPFIALAIIPAQGWKAVFADEDGVYKLPLACFALQLHEDGTQDVVGMCACLEGVIDNAEHHDNLLGYEGPGEDNDWADEYVEWYGQNFKTTKKYNAADSKFYEN